MSGVRHRAADSGDTLRFCTETAPVQVVHRRQSLQRDVSKRREGHMYMTNASCFHDDMTHKLTGSGARLTTDRLNYY